MTDPIRELLKDLTKPDNEVCQALEKRLADILRPSGALKRLDEIAIFMGGWQGSLTPRVERPKVLIFAADHGVATAGVSAYPSSVTESMMLSLIHI